MKHILEIVHLQQGRKLKLSYILQFHEEVDFAEDRQMWGKEQLQELEDLMSYDGRLSDAGE